MTTFQQSLNLVSFSYLSRMLSFAFTEVACPISHPFAYFGGSYCCKYNREKFYQPQGPLCDGSIIGLDSKCCRSDAHTKCPAGEKMCRNYEGKKNIYIGL